MRLLKDGAYIRAMVRTTAKTNLLKREGVVLIQGDMTDAFSLKKAIQDCPVVFHCAAVLPDRCEPLSYFRSVNVEGTRTLAEAAIKEEVKRFIHLSTVSVYGMDAKVGTNENSPRLLSKKSYSDTKLEGENIIRELIQKSKLQALIIQPTQVYGPGDKHWTLKPFQLIQKRRAFLPSGGRGLIQPIYIDDLVNGVLAAAQRGKIGETYILGGSQIVTIKEYFSYFAKMGNQAWIPSLPKRVALFIATLIEWLAKLTHRSPLFTYEEVRETIMQATYDSSKAKSELGFVATTTLERGMQLVKTWLKQEGYLPHREENH